ncbi:hypothetical protein H2509_20445, partial [Stappia sp. F7233]|uniref:Uncharacterized protein n=1 Tax=Stappia albiluteola TaxID=2758565 RepID=A0A839AI90_9HYPH|nr:hypothetical protein [Stappia albiluteola]MBA5778229.1 hypothetical protein [Stappia albiluteola]MBA5778243.1 hypothetical protein [Stappia albiluteola]MBA5779477.1 hypothetical protein [Stappia albiluteola]MBA5779507.1 hypothetical protein [Stappia albiluteola]
MSGKSLNDLARDLARARAAADRRPDDKAAEIRFHEARIAYLEAELFLCRKDLAHWQLRSMALGRALRRRVAAYRRLAETASKGAIKRRSRGPAPVPAQAVLFEIVGQGVAA